MKWEPKPISAGRDTPTILPFRYPIAPSPTSLRKTNPISERWPAGRSGQLYKQTQFPPPCRSGDRRSREINVQNKANFRKGGIWTKPFSGNELCQVHRSQLSCQTKPIRPRRADREIGGPGGRLGYPTIPSFQHSDLTPAVRNRPGLRARAEFMAVRPTPGREKQESERSSVNVNPLLIRTKGKSAQKFAKIASSGRSKNRPLRAPNAVFPEGRQRAVFLK